MGHCRSHTVDTHKRDSVDTAHCLEPSVGQRLVAVGCAVVALRVGIVEWVESLRGNVTVVDLFVVVAAEGAVVAVAVVATVVVVVAVVATVVVVVEVVVAVGVGVAVAAAAASSAAVAVSTAAVQVVVVAAADIVAVCTAPLSSVAGRGTAGPAVPGGTPLKPDQHPSDLELLQQLSLYKHL